MTADGKPIIGAAGGVDGLFVHGGDNGWGVESAPEAGRRLAEIVVAGVDSAGQPVPHRPPIDHPAEGATRHVLTPARGGRNAAGQGSSTGWSGCRSATGSPSHCVAGIAR